MFPTLRVFFRGKRSRAAVLLLVAALTGLAAATPRKRTFDIPGGPAIESFKKFTAQSGEQLLYSVEAVETVTTRPLKGEFTAHAALERMLLGTPLRVAADRTNGALTVTRAASPKRPVGSAGQPRPR